MKRNQNLTISRIFFAMKYLTISITTLSFFLFPLKVVNFSSETNAFPASAPSEIFTNFKKGDFVTDGTNIYGVDILDEKIMIDIHIPPMQFVSLYKTNGKKLFPDWGNEGGLHLIRFPGNINFRLDQNGIAIEDRYMLYMIKSRWWKKAYEGYSVIRIRTRTEGPKEGTLIIDCFSKGNARIISENQNGFRPHQSMKTVLKSSDFTPSQTTDGDIIEGPFEYFILDDFVIFIPPKSSKWIFQNGILKPVTKETTEAFLIRKKAALTTRQTADSALWAMIGKTGSKRMIFKNDQATAFVSGSSLLHSTWNWYSRDKKNIGKWIFHNHDSLNTFNVFSGTKGNIKEEILITKTSDDPVFLKGSLLTGGRLYEGRLKNITANDYDRDGDPDAVTTAGEKIFFDLYDNLNEAAFLKTQENLCHWSNHNQFSKKTFQQKPMPGYYMIAGKNSFGEKTFVSRTKKKTRMTINVLSGNDISLNIYKKGGFLHSDSGSFRIILDAQQIGQAPEREIYNGLNQSLKFRSVFFPADWNGKTCAIDQTAKKYLTYALKVKTGKVVLSDTHSNITGLSYIDGRLSQELSVSKDAFTAIPFLRGTVKSVYTNFYKSRGPRKFYSVTYSYDLNLDGFPETFLLDKDGNGKIEKFMHYNKQNGILRIDEKRNTTFFPYPLASQTESLVNLNPGELTKIAEYFSPGQKKAPLLNSISLASSGIPIEWKYGKTNLMFREGMFEKRPEFFLIFKNSGKLPSNRQEALTYNNAITLSNIIIQPKTKTFSLKSPPCLVKIPRHSHERQIFINNKKISRRSEGMFDLISVPSGIKNIRLIDEDISHDL